MSQKTRVLNVRVVGFSAPERQMLNSIFLLSVAPARQIGYKLWNSESGTAPDMYLLDGDSESAVASWQAAFSNTFERTLVVGSKNTDLGCTSAARPLGLKVVGAMDRLAIALNNVAKEAAGLDASGPRAGTMPPAPASDTSATMPMKQPDSSLPRAATPQPSLSASMAAAISSGATLSATLTANSATLAANPASLPAASLGATSTAGGGTMPTSMTAAAPAATVLPNVTLQPNVTPMFDKTITDRPLTEKTVDRILSDKGVEKVYDRVEKPGASSLPPTSGATPLSPSALAAAVAPRASLRVVAPPVSMAASLPSAAPVAARIADAPMARSIVEAPMNPPAAVPVSRIADAPMNPNPPAAPARPVVDSPMARSIVEPPARSIMDAPMNPPPLAPAARSIADAPMNPTPPAPAAPAARPAAEMRSSVDAPAAAGARPEDAFRVLTVDDSPLMRTFLQNKLAPYGISPEFAASGEEALYKISKQHFDLIFLDVMLPGMDGYDVCKMIKKNKDNNLMKVVMLTSKDKTFDRIRGTMAGCDGYLTKPVDEMKLRAIIERHTPSNTKK
jgi:CheY-like chemotaxis protein